MCCAATAARRRIAWRRARLAHCAQSVCDTTPERGGGGGGYSGGTGCAAVVLRRVDEQVGEGQPLQVVRHIHAPCECHSCTAGCAAGCAAFVRNYPTDRSRPGTHPCWSAPEKNRFAGASPAFAHSRRRCLSVCGASPSSHSTCRGNPIEVGDHSGSVHNRSPAGLRLSAIVTAAAVRTASAERRTIFVHAIHVGVSIL